MDFSGVMAIVFEIPLFFGPPCTYYNHDIHYKNNLYHKKPSLNELLVRIKYLLLNTK